MTAKLEAWSLVDWPPDAPDTELIQEIRAACDAETDPILRAYLASLARLAQVSSQLASYELTRYQEEIQSPSPDHWHWRWRAEIDAWGGDPQAAFYARWLATAQAFPDPESAYRLAALRRCAETTPQWAARELDSFWQREFPH